MPPVAEAVTDTSVDQDDQDIQGTERDAESFEGPPGIGQDPVPDPVGITDPSSNPDPVVEAPAEEVAVETPWDDTLLSLAEKYDLTPDRAKSYGSPEVLRSVMLDIDRSASKWGKQYLEQQYPQQEQAEQPQQTQQTQQVQPAQTQQQAAQQLQAAIDKYKIELDADYDPDALRVFNGINDHYHKIITDRDNEYRQYIALLAQRSYEQEQAIQQYTGRQQAEGEAQLLRDVDTFVTKSDATADVYGRSPTHRLAKDSPLLAERQKLVAEMQQLEAAYGDRFSRAELFEKAHAILHSDKIKQTVRKEIQQQVRAQQETQIERSTGTKPRPKKGVDAAREFVNSHPLIKAVRSGQF